MRHIMATILAFTLFGTVLGAEGPSLQIPETGESPDTIRNALRPFKGFGYVQSAHFDRWGQEIVLFWYCPFSGRSACFLHGYNYDPEGKKWICFLNDLVEGTHDLSPAMPCAETAVVVNDAKGKRVRKIDVSKFPRKKWEDENGKDKQPAGSDAKDRSTQQ